MGKIEGLWVKRFRGGPMDPRDRVAVVANRGIVGNKDQGGRRQITLVARERWDEVIQEVGATLAPEMRRANVLVSGVDLQESRGRTLRAGSCRLRITGETRPCEQMEAAFPGLGDAMERRWGGGAHAEVLDGGEMAVGDTVAWEPCSSD